MLKLVRTSALAALAAMAAIVPVSAAHGQKPALTENIEEKGRVPYYDSNSSGANCNSNICTISFKPVPAGYRLVITHASGQYVAVSSQADNYAELESGTPAQGGNYGYSAFLPTPAAAGSVWYRFSSPITFYVEPGQIPKLAVGNAQTAEAFATISGYLVSIP